MIIPPSRSSVYYPDLPFSASINIKEMKVSFSEGRVFNCYDLSGNEFGEFEHGARYKRLTGVFEFEYEDWFFVDARYQVEYSEIYKVSKTERLQKRGHSNKERPVLIWKAPKEGERVGEQIIGENIFIQDHDSCREKGFSNKKNGYLEGKYKHKINPGFVIAPQTGFIKFVQGIKKEQGDTEERIKFRLKISAEVSVSGPDPNDYGEIGYINGFDVLDAVLEEYTTEDDDDPAFLSHAGDHLSGIYYIHEPDLGDGNVVLTLSTTNPDVVLVSPDFETQVRGAGFYKNGVSASNFEINEGEEGFYKKIVETKIYSKKTIGEGGGVEDAGDHEVVTTHEVEEEPNISEFPPVVTVTVEEDPLDEDDFLIYPAKETRVSLEGEEISNSAYRECRGKAREFPFTPINDWEGDGTAILDGAGYEGAEEKIIARVRHAERRFKRAGLIEGDFENIDLLPNEFYHATALIFTDGEGAEDARQINLNKNKEIYEDEIWQELKGEESGVFVKEILDNECSTHEKGEYLYMNITKYAKEKYQVLNIAANTNSII